MCAPSQSEQDACHYQPAKVRGSIIAKIGLAATPLAVPVRHQLLGLTARDAQIRTLSIRWTTAGPCRTWCPLQGTRCPTNYVHDLYITQYRGPHCLRCLSSAKVKGSFDEENVLDWNVPCIFPLLVISAGVSDLKANRSTWLCRWGRFRI